MYGHEDPLPQGAQPAQSAYSLNGTQLGTHTAGQSGSNATLFFHAPDLPPGLHSLTISVLQASNSSAYNFTSDSPSTTNSSSASSSPYASSSSAASGGRSTLPLGAIVGIAVGATLLLCGAILVLVRRWKRRRAARLAGDFAYGPKGHYGAFEPCSCLQLGTDVDGFRRDAYRSGHGLIRERGTARMLPRLRAITPPTISYFERRTRFGRASPLSRRSSHVRCAFGGGTTAWKF